MKDHAGSERGKSAGRRILELAAVSLAASACGEVAPADDARVATLSPTEVIALCDELRDALDDRPVQCEFGEMHWVVPSNQSCRDAELMSCSASVGDVRAWHEQARSEPCAEASNAGAPTAATSDPRDNCHPLVPSPEVAAFTCPESSLSLLQRADGVYEPRWDAMLDPARCDWPLPALLDRGALLFVLVATQASGTPEIILKSCSAIADCQTLARELREVGEPLSTDADDYRYNHFTACGAGIVGFDFPLLSRAPAGVPSCEAEWLPNSSVWPRDSELTPDVLELTIFLDTGRRGRASPGCGYVVAPSIEEDEACHVRPQFTARFVAPL